MPSPQQAVSIAGLQAELDALEALCPVLLPSVVPNGYDDEDLWGIVQTEGKEQKEQFRVSLRDAVKRRQKQQGEESACCVCGAAGVLVASHEPTEDESSTLRFTTLPQVSFQERTVRIHKAGFACGQCRALREAGRFLNFLGAPPRSQHVTADIRQAMAAALCLHFASTNQAPEEVQSNGDALTVWTQEVMSRVYALQVLGSALPGWKVLGPSDQLVTQSSAGLAVTMLQQLLTPAKPKTKRKSSSEPPQEPSLPHASGTRKADKQQTSTPGRSSKPKPSAPVIEPVKSKKGSSAKPAVQDSHKSAKQSSELPSKHKPAQNGHTGKKRKL